MKQQGIYGRYRFHALGLAVIYVFIAAAHLFFTPGFADGNLLNQNSVLKRNTDLVYNLIRTDRCFSKDSKETVILFKDRPATNPSHSTDKCSRLLVKATSYYSNQFIPDRHFSFLSNRVLRI